MYEESDRAQGVCNQLTASATNEDDERNEVELVIGSTPKADDKTVERELDEMLDDVRAALPTDDATVPQSVTPTNR